MVDEHIGDAQANDPNPHAFLGQQFEHARAESAPQHIVLNRDHQWALARGLQQQLAVQRLHETRVDDSRMDPLFGQQVPRFERMPRHRPDAHQRDIRTLAQPAPLADFKPPGGLGHVGRRLRVPAREPQRDRTAFMQRGGVRHVAQLFAVHGRHHYHPRNHAQVTQVERAVVRRPVGANQPAAIEREKHRQLLNRHVVNDLIDRPLQERRVDADDRPQPVAGHPRGRSHRVLLGDAHIVGAIGKLFLEAELQTRQPGPLQHRGRDGDDAIIAPGGLAQRVNEHLRQRRRTGLLGRRPPVQRIEVRWRAVVLDRVGLGVGPPLALLRVQVQQDRTLAVADLLQQRHQVLQVMTVQRTEVTEPECLEQLARQDQILHRLLEPIADLQQLVAGRQPADQLADLAPLLVVDRMRHDAVERVGKRAHILRD